MHTIQHIGFVITSDYHKNIIAETSAAEMHGTACPVNHYRLTDIIIIKYHFSLFNFSQYTVTTNLKLLHS